MPITTDHDHRIIDAVSFAMRGMVGDGEAVQRLLAETMHHPVQKQITTLAEIAVAFARWCRDLKEYRGDGIPCDFQTRAAAWARLCVGAEDYSDRRERAARFLEEAAELAQAAGLDQDKAAELIQYVYGRPVGEVGQEIGGVMITLATLAELFSVSIPKAAENELGRVWANIETIRAKHQAKPRGATLPGYADRPDKNPVLKPAAKAIREALRVMNGDEPPEIAGHPDTACVRLDEATQILRRALLELP